MEAITGISNPYEEYICAKASLNNIPIGGNFELLPYCNMDCKMCYVRMDKKQVDILGGLRPKEFWIDLAENAKKQGVLFVLLTGGEPLLYPEFFELYKTLQSMGLILTVNTNGTLIDEEIAEFWGQNLPRRINITIYGKDNETYAKLCGNPKGFSQLEHAIHLLKRHKVPIKLNCSLTIYNYHQLNEIRDIASNWEIPIEIAYYMMPPNRKFIQGHNKYRITPKQAAAVAFDIAMEKLSSVERTSKAKKMIEKINNVPENTLFSSGFRCRAGNAGFWVNWKGEMVPCGMLNEPSYDLVNNSFRDCWKEMVQNVSQICLSSKCHVCKKRSICIQCAASAIAETGRFDAESQYLCELCYEYEKLLKKEVGE